MRKALFVVALTATLTACALAPDHDQLQLATRLKASPPKTILLTYKGDAGYVGGQKMAFVGYEEVCNVLGNEVEVARIGSWACPSFNSKLSGLGTDTAINIITRHLVFRVIQPGDADYNEHLRKMMAEEVLYQPGPSISA